MVEGIKSVQWSDLVCKIGLTEVNAELDRRMKVVLDGLRSLASVCRIDVNLISRLKSQVSTWLPACDQYLRTVLHLAALQGNTRLVKCLVFSGAEINARDGIGQTALTISLHYNHDHISLFLTDTGAALREEYFPETVCPLRIAQVKNNTRIKEAIEKKILEDKSLDSYISSSFETDLMDVDEPANDRECEKSGEKENGCENYARALNINVGDQKNTVTVQGCANSCPDIYGCHTPGSGDFHNRGYLNESLARIGGQGGFWHVVEKIMKRPTVNPTSFKQKFKDNNFNNNEEAIYDYEDGLSIALIKAFESSEYFPTAEEFEESKNRDGCHNTVLVKKFNEWRKSNESDIQAKYHIELALDLIPISRWYKESIRNGNGEAVEAVWMLLPPIYAQMGKTNYRDESLSHLVNILAKWPLAYRKMYLRNRTVNVKGKQGTQLAGDEWVEDHLVCPVKRYAKAQTSFSVLEMMSCSTNLLETNRAMYKSREAFDIHRTKKHCTPLSTYDQLKVAQFALREKWFENAGRKGVKKYPWGEKTTKEGETVASKYIDAVSKGQAKVKQEFISFLHRKFPNEMR